MVPWIRTVHTHTQWGQLRLRDTICLFIKILPSFSPCRNQLQHIIEAACNKYYEYLLTIKVLIFMYSILSRAATRKFVIWHQILSTGRIAGTTFQHLQIILNLLEGGSEQFRRCVPGEVSDTHFYPNLGGFRPTKWLNLGVSHKR